ncbi:aminotransferase class V-fold PLP-dependent enzyme [Bartonella tamiae]|uniref:Cysteine desulfurase n=1 Tax=Bartonella tamiae Th239 TaxID=1094558 RepID=J1JV80_9HYPH|nr:cysteine desulfurase [Bartonella tamiae]EJF88882.1 cysteine desulfurase, SufS subfamily [Bartonella tamiae Th239]EJF94868.1 cysteine desulfurase, SufS subfamily [Bartonella tamiae Th307]
MAVNSSTMTYDVEAIRRDFPILQTKVYGKRLAYLDNGASAQKPQIVLDTMNALYETGYANVHRGLHYLSNAATDAYENARKITAQFLNSPSPDTIVFTKNATEAINTVAYGWGMPHIGKDQEIVITIMEHHSNIVPWHFIREIKGAKLVFIPVDENGAIDLEAFQKALSDRTRMVAITHMSNMLGTILPIKKMIKIAHEHDIPVLIDGAQGAVHLPVDVQDLDCDWYVMTGHKLYGPTGIGVLYGKKERLEAMRPFQGGGEMIEEVRMDSVTYNAPPHRFEAGTPPIVEAVGLGAALKYMMQIGRESLFLYEKALAHYAHDKLSKIENVQIFGNAPDKGGIFSFNIKNIHAHDVSMYIDRQGVAIRAGTHCAQPLLQRFGVSSTCRASLAMYNNYDDIDQLVDAIEKARIFFND